MVKETRLFENLTEKERLIDLLIHDLRGPLSVVATSTSNLLQKERYGVLNDRQRHAIERIGRNTRKAQTLLGEIVEIFKSGEGLFKKDLFLIEETLKESVIGALEATSPQVAENLCQVGNDREFNHVLERQGIFFEIAGKYRQSPFCHDQKKIELIFRNLISNGLKYRKTRVRVSIRGDKNLLGIVENDGTGIPLEEQKAVFNRFVRLERHAHIPGLGLGLSGVNALVRAMEGKITLESRPGTGVSFTIRIPPLG
jgi:signal transduction histidine kinase